MRIGIWTMKSLVATKGSWPLVVTRTWPDYLGRGEGVGLEADRRLLAGAMEMYWFSNQRS